MGGAPTSGTTGGAPRAGDSCAIHLAQDIVGGKWNLIVLWHLQDGSRRFSELEAAIAGVSQKALTEALRFLECAGLIARTVLPERPPRVDYQLTAVGAELVPVIRALEAWGAAQRPLIERARAARRDHRLRPR